jgi:hypothetical protein
MEGNWSGTLGAFVGLLCGSAILLGFVGYGIYLIYTAVSGKRKAQASQQWLSTSGKILESRIVQTTSTDDDGNTTTSYHLAAKYEYEVGGRQYINDKCTIGRVPKPISRKRTQETLARYPVGGVVPVYYNPQNPQEAVLDREAPLSNTVLIIGIAIVLFFGCLACSVLCLLSRMLPDLIARISGS